MGRTSLVKQSGVMLAASLILVGLVGCNQKKSDTDLFEQSPVRVYVTADTTRGIEPLMVQFSGYLETEETTVVDEISEIKWIIDGPGTFKREIVHESYNYQDESANVDNFFHMEYDFSTFGNYKVWIELKGGQYRSKPVRINVEKDRNQRY